MATLSRRVQPDVNSHTRDRNIIADVLSRLPTNSTGNEEEILTVTPVEYETKFLMTYENVRKEQQLEINQNKTFWLKIRQSPKFQYKVMEKHELLMENNKIYVPKAL